MRWQRLPSHCITLQKPLFHISFRLRFKTLCKVIQIPGVCCMRVYSCLGPLQKCGKINCASFTYRISVSWIERVKSSVKHPELPGSSRSVHRLWSWENKPIQVNCRGNHRVTGGEVKRPGLLSGSGQVLFRMCMVAPDWIPQASSVRSSFSLRPQCTSSWYNDKASTQI